MKQKTGLAVQYLGQSRLVISTLVTWLVVDGGNVAPPKGGSWPSGVRRGSSCADIETVTFHTRHSRKSHKINAKREVSTRINRVTHSA